MSRVKNWGDEVEAEEMRSNVRRDMHRSVASVDFLFYLFQLHCKCECNFLIQYKDIVDILFKLLISDLSFSDTEEGFLKQIFLKETEKSHLEGL